MRRQGEAENRSTLRAAIVQGKPIQVIQDTGPPTGQSTLAETPHPSIAQCSQREIAPQPPPEAPQPHVWSSAQTELSEPTSVARPTMGPPVQGYLRVLWVGIGCERGTPQAVIDQAIDAALASQGLAAAAIAGVATLDRKAKEPGLRACCRDRDLPLRCFTAAQLRSVPVPTPSDGVGAAVGTPSVAEAAALLAAGAMGTAIAPGREPRLLVPKQIVRHSNQPGAVTIAIAQTEVA